jgi:integrase
VKADGSADRRHRKGRTEAEVTRKVRELEGQRETGYVSKPGRVPTLAEWMTEYLDVLCERLVLSETMAPRTLADYRSKTRNWIIPLLGKHRLDRLTADHLDGAYAVMLQEALGHTRVTTTERYTHVATLQMKDASDADERSALGPKVTVTATRIATFGHLVSQTLSLDVPGEGR